MSRRFGSGPGGFTGDVEEPTELDHPTFDTPAAQATTGGAQRVQTASEDDVALEPGTMVGDYRVEHKLGQGGMGTVYAAVHPLIGKRAAIKVLRHRHFDTPRALERFVQEARAVNEIAHHNIVDIFSFGGLPDGRAYLIMELLEGQTLASALAERSLSFGDAVEILVQVCRALDAAHAKGIIHRDLKPDNIFLARRDDDAPHVKLLDFGIAKYTDAGESGPIHSTETGMVMGTPGYVPPEQAKGKPVSAKTDVYSLACIAYEAFTGRLPFAAETAVELVSMHLYVPAPDPRQAMPDLPPPLADAMLAMLAKTPDERPEVRQFRSVLESMRTFDLVTSNRLLPGPSYGRWDHQVENKSPPQVPQSSPPPPPSAIQTNAPVRAPAGPSTMPTAAAPQPGARTRGGVAAAAAVALVAAGVGLALILSGENPPDEEITVAEPDVEIAVPVPRSTAAVDHADEAAPAAHENQTRGESQQAPDPDAAVVGQPQPRRLTLHVRPVTANVRIDGQSREVVDGRVEVEVEGERTRVEVSAGGFVKDSQLVSIEEGGEEELSIELRRKPRTRPRGGGNNDVKHDPDGTVDPFKN